MLKEFFLHFGLFYFQNAFRPKGGGALWIEDKKRAF
jgi:hypothetical protein